MGARPAGPPAGAHHPTAASLSTPPALTRSRGVLGVCVCALGCFDAGPRRARISGRAATEPTTMTLPHPSFVDSAPWCRTPFFGEDSVLWCGLFQIDR